MTSELYPIFLKLQDRAVLIVGGGALALQKVRSLRPSGARLTVAAPRLCPELAQAAGAGAVVWLRHAYPNAALSRPLAEAVLVFAATDDPAVNARVVAEARARGVLANAVDEPEHCDFYTPAIVRHPAVTLALSTAGVFPGLARVLREVLQALLPPEDADLHGALPALRERLRRNLAPERRREALQTLLDGIRERYLLAEDPGAQGSAMAASVVTAEFTTLEHG